VTHKRVWSDIQYAVLYALEFNRIAVSVYKLLPEDDTCWSTRLQLRGHLWATGECHLYGWDLYTPGADNHRFEQVVERIYGLLDEVYPSSDVQARYVRARALRREAETIFPARYLPVLRRS
jgi:hypothetical protein